MSRYSLYSIVLIQIFLISLQVLLIYQFSFCTARLKLVDGQSKMPFQRNQCTLEFFKKYTLYTGRLTHSGFFLEVAPNFCFEAPNLKMFQGANSPHLSTSLVNHLSLLKDGYFWEAATYFWVKTFWNPKIVNNYSSPEVETTSHWYLPNRVAVR